MQGGFASTFQFPLQVLLLLVLEGCLQCWLAAEAAALAAGFSGTKTSPPQFSTGHDDFPLLGVTPQAQVLGSGNATEPTAVDVP